MRPKPSIPTVGGTPADQSHTGAVLVEHIDTRSPTAMAFAVAAFRDAHESLEILKNIVSIFERYNFFRQA